MAEEILKAIAADAVEGVIQAAEQAVNLQKERRTTSELELEQSRYEATLLRAGTKLATPTIAS